MFDLYKPFRNRVRALSAFPALEVIYAYIQFLQFDVPLPAALALPHLAYKSRHALGMFEWEIELLAREILVNAPEHGSRAIGSWAGFSELMNMVKRLENEAYGLRDDASDIFFELTRIAHRQWPWQAGLHQGDLARYFRLYDHPAVRPLVEDVHGMSPTQLYQIGLSLAGIFQDGMYARLPIANHINGVDQAVIDQFIDRFSATLQEHAHAARDAQSYDVNWAYGFNPLRLRPLVRTPDDSLALPVTPFLIRRLMDGLYFDIVGAPGFGTAIGASFQAYVGDVLEAANRTDRLTILAERPYGSKKRREDSVDWLVGDDSAILFVECKVARLKLAAKTDLRSRAVLREEIDKLAGYVVQMFATLQDALDGRYPHWSPDDRPIFPIIVTLDEWNAFGHHIHDMLAGPVERGLAGKGIDAKIVERFPFQLCSVAEFEPIAQIMANRSIAHVMAAKLEGEHRLWPFQSFVRQHLHSEWLECRELFPGIWPTLEKSALSV